MCKELCLLGCEGVNPFCFALSRLSVMRSTRFNAYSLIKVFAFSTVLVERVPGLRKDFIFNYIAPTTFNRMIPN